MSRGNAAMAIRDWVHRDQKSTTIKNNRSQVSHSLKMKLQIWKGEKKQNNTSTLNWNYSYRYELMKFNRKIDANVYTYRE